MDCLFCKFATKEIPLDFIFENEDLFSINDISPQAPTHILIIPKRHYENAAELAFNEGSTLVQMFQIAKELAERNELNGYRTVFNTGSSAGQSVFHAHLHLLGGRDFTWPPG